MKTCIHFATIFAILFLLILPTVLARNNVGHARSGYGGENGWAKRIHTVEIAGSRLPDCSHACGSCSPCKLVIVGSVCASLSEAEPCPISYRCMCNGKSFPVP